MKRKKIAAVLLITVMSLVGILSGCGQNKVTDTINIATLNGPTGMGMASLMDETSEYNIKAYQSPDEIISKIITGEVDLAAVPSNLAAVLYNKTDGQIVAVSAITLGVLYIMENGSAISDMSQLKGKTILASGKGGTPEYVLQKILQENGLVLGKDVKVEWLANHTEVMNKLIATDDTIAMLPEPFVTTCLKKDSGKVKIAFDMNALWAKETGSDLPMGVLVAQKSFVEKRGNDLKIFLADYGKSVKNLNDDPSTAAKVIAEKGFIANAQIAEAAIPNCNIVLYKKGGSTILLENFYKILYKLNPASVGGKLPGEDLYY